MSLPKSYAEVGARVDIQLADWRERRVTRSGVRRYLMLAYHEIPQDRGDEPSWLRLWAQICWVRGAARYDLHVTIPPELWAEDKARLAAKIAASTDIHFPDEKERALRWTRRKT